MAAEKRRSPRPLTDEDSEAVRALHAQGHGRNEIARRIDRSPRIVSELAAEMGLSFDRTATAVATEARVIDARARRVALMERYNEHAHKQLDRLDREEHHITEVSIGKVVRYKSPDLPSADVRNLMQASIAASNQSAKLEALDSDNGASEAKSMIGRLAVGLNAAYSAMNEGAGDAP